MYCKTTSTKNLQKTSREMGSLILLLCIVNAYYATASSDDNSYDISQAIFTGFEELPQGTLIDDLNTNEISGITYNSFDGSYYAIVDNLIPNKGFYKYTFTVSDTQMVSFDLVSGTQMDPSAEAQLTGMDSEGIVFIKNPQNPSKSYFIIAQEGHKVFNTENELYLYQTDGTYIRTISDQLNPLYSVINTENNRGVEAISVDLEQKHIVYTTEKPLLSDNNFCNCIRISINNFEVDNDNNNVKFNELYQLRYDLDAITSTQPGAFNGASDILVFQNEEGDLNGLVLERAFLGVETTQFGDIPLFENKIYLVDLTENDNNKDVKYCNSLSDKKCSNINGIDKILLFEFSGNVNTNIPQRFLNFETISILYDGNSIYNENGMVNLVAITDNDNYLDTHFVYLQYDANVDIDHDSDSDSMDFAAGLGNDHSDTEADRIYNVNIDLSSSLLVVILMLIILIVLLVCVCRNQKICRNI
eukprot:228423_1